MQSRIDSRFFFQKRADSDPSHGGIMASIRQLNTQDGTKGKWSVAVWVGDVRKSKTFKSKGNAPFLQGREK